MEPVDIAGRRIGEGPCFVIAEAGVNHNGDPVQAHALIDAAAASGADAVKFQTFDPEQVAARRATRAEYQTRALGEDGSQVDMLRRLVLPRDVYPALIRHAHDCRLTFLSTPFDEGSADFLETLDVPAFKVSSGDLTNALLLRHLARKGKPLLISTGMADLEDVRSALAQVREVAQVPLVLLHCVSNYPADPADCNLRAMEVMRLAFDVPVGFSDHTLDSSVAVAAAALGAAVLEKHLTLDRALPGPDHQASADPREFRAMVTWIRQVERAVGSGRKAPAASEQPIADIGRRSLHWKRAMRQGDTVGEADLIALRPASGISPARWRTIVGRRLARDAGAHEPVGLEDLEP